MDIFTRRRRERSEETRLIEQLRARQAGINRGEVDPLAGQPTDNTSLLMISLGDQEDDPTAKFGNIVAMNIFLSARAILDRTHRIATGEEVAAGGARDKAELAKHLAQEDKTNNRRTVRVEPLTPMTGGK
jgi:hypothetical protein